MADLKIPTSSANETAEFLLSKPSTTYCQSLFDVFINHRGVDAKNSIANLLYHYLQGRGLSVFLDSEEFELGDHIPDKIKDAIRSSSVQIAILSENYASSPWCLAELALMLETNAKIVPVFYRIPPYFARHCLGVYADAFSKHESDGRYRNAEIKKWKEALHKASNIKGWEWNDHKEQGQLCKDILDTVLREVKRISSLEVAEHPVGLEEAVGDFNRRREREKNPKLVGIVGMCGSGKTTLAKKLFDVNRSAFDASCFLLDVCKTSAENNLAALQRKFLKQLLNLHLEIDSVDEGKGILNDRFAKVETTSRFLIILDGIDHKEQVDALLVQEVLQTNSLIIITSRDRSVFTSRPQAMLYEMKSMAEKHARELFCRHAFNQPSPVIGSENVVDGFMRQCDGLPLLLKEFGALLNGKSEKKEWEIELHNSFKTLNRDIKNKPQTSYDALEGEEKEMFQDVSCFFTGHPKNTAITIWNASGWSGDIGLQKLKYKSLIEVHHGGELSMHNLFKYFGRYVASESTRDKKFQRIWESARINKLERQGFERVLRKGCNFRSFLHLPYSHGKQQLYENSRNKHSSAMNQSSRSSELSKVHFFVGNDSLHLGGSRSSSDLLWLKWENCPHKCIPSWIPMESLRHLEVIDGDLEHLWRANSEGPLELTQLIIQRNPLTVLPRQFGCLTNLQHIDFHGCNQLEALPSSFSCLIQLQYLNLSNCESLRLEPCNLSFGHKSDLKTLHLLGTTVDEEVLNQIVKLSSLESLIIGSDSLKSLPSVKELSLLKYFSIRKSEVEHLPEGIGELTNLQTLEVEDCPLTELTFTNSKKVKFEDPETVCLYKPQKFFNILHYEGKSSIGKPMCMLRLENITLQNTNVRMITISREFCPSLKTLNLKENKHLVECDLSLGSMLECLCLSGCSRLKRISGMCDLVKLKELAISGCCELEDLPSLAPLTALERFTADQCWKLHNIGGVELLKGLKEFRLVADNGAIWNCFHGLQRLPSQEMILGGRAAAVAELGDQEWINFSASDDPDGTTYVIGGDKIRLWGSLNTTSVVTIICLVIESFSENSWVRFWGFPDVLDLDGAIWIKAGEWIIASVFATEIASSWKGDIGNLERFQVMLAKSTCYEVKKAFIAMVNKGDEGNITEFLNEIFVSKKDARAPEQSEPNFKLQESVKARQCSLA